MKILITGSSGFLGRRSAAHFASLGHTVLAPARTQLDITDEGAVQEWFQKHQPEAVIHCAAVSDTGLCQKDPEGSARINVTGSTNLAAACAVTGAKFVFCSSDQVYAGNSLPGPHRESEILSPGNVYGRQKLLAEQQCQTICPETVSLRLSWMYATRSMPGEHGHLLTTLCNAIKDETLPLSWPVYDHRGITNADSVVARLPAVLHFPAGIYNFGAENDRNTFSTIQTVLQELDLQNALSRLTPNPEAFADRPRDIRMDTTLTNSMGVFFDNTCDELCKALYDCLQVTQ